MQYVAEHTTVPLAEVLKVYDYGTGQHIVMRELRGADIKVCYGGMTDAQVKTFGAELAACLTQLRSLPPPDPGRIGSVLSGPNHDHSLSGSAFGPFADIADFHQYIRLGRPLAHWENEPDVVRVHSRPPDAYRTVFTHADLKPNNIMAKDGHIMAIIDWEFAGWYPEHWDYAKMHWCPRIPLWNNFYKAIEGEEGIVKYPEELACEGAVWKRMHPWSYDEPPWGPTRVAPPKVSDTVEKKEKKDSRHQVVADRTEAAVPLAAA